jgi:hypothetical protein
MSDEIKTIRYFNKNIRDDIKLVRTITRNKNYSFFHSILTCTVSDYVTFSTDKKNKLVEKYITSLRNSFHDNLTSFYNYILEKSVKPEFSSKILKKSSYIELYHIICSLVKIKDLDTSKPEIKIILQSGKDIINKTKIQKEKKDYFYGKFKDLITSVWEVSKNNDIIIDNNTIKEVSKNLYRNIYCIDYYNDERIVFSSNTKYSKTILIVKINDNYEPVGILKQGNIVKRDLFSSDPQVEKILKILRDSVHSESQITEIDSESCSHIKSHSENVVPEKDFFSPSFIKPSFE